MRKAVIAANWKMHTVMGEARQLASEVVTEVKGVPVDVILCPPFTALATVASALAGSPIHLGAQNVHWEREGPFTGEISPPMLVDLGCTYVLVGHSERRQQWGEGDAEVARKVRASLAAGLTPIICVGEDWPERERGETQQKVASQVRASLDGLDAAEAARVIFAYEPVWAIGSGRHADGETAATVCGWIREEVAISHGDDVARRVRTLYGGSVKPDNIGDYARQPDVDGALVGGASLAATSFGAIVRGWAAEGRAQD